MITKSRGGPGLGGARESYQGHLFRCSETFEYELYQLDNSIILVLNSLNFIML